MMLNPKNALIALAAAAGFGAFVILHKRSASASVDVEAQTSSAPPPPQALDASLSPVQAHAVNTALAVETNAANLYAFSVAMLPDFPIAASLLNRRAVALMGQ